MNDPADYRNVIGVPIPRDDDDHKGVAMPNSALRSSIRMAIAETPSVEDAVQVIEELVVTHTHQGDREDERGLRMAALHAAQQMNPTRDELVAYAEKILAFLKAGDGA